ncbi:MAG: hypothetical protein NTX63_04485 [Candidatus Peregrinibacteria bacterium]|nr:hypothetical protein [Candidatus Peregrinibacteria bacterium]
MFRKILTIAIFSVFVLCSVPFFLGLAISHTFFSRSFYTGTLLNTAYEPLSNVVARNMLELDPVLQQSISADEIRTYFASRFTKNILRSSIETTSSAFSKDVLSVLPNASSSEKLKAKLDFTPLVEPSKLFLQDITQQVLERLPPCAAGKLPEIAKIFPNCIPASSQQANFKTDFNASFQKEYQQNVLKSVVGSEKTGFVRDVTLDVPLRDVAFALHQFERMDMYIVFFVLAFVSLVLLLWFRNLHTGLTLSSLMIVTASVLGLLIAMILSKIVSLLPTDVVADSSVSESTIILARDLLSVILVSFAKVYAVIQSIMLVIGGALYFYVHRYLKKI